MGMLFFEAIYTDLQSRNVSIGCGKKPIDCKVVLLKILFGILMSERIHLPPLPGQQSQIGSLFMILGPSQSGGSKACKRWREKGRDGSAEMNGD